MPCRLLRALHVSSLIRTTVGELGEVDDELGTWRCSSPQLSAAVPLLVLTRALLELLQALCRSSSCCRCACLSCRCRCVSEQVDLWRRTRARRTAQQRDCPSFSSSQDSPTSRACQGKGRRTRATPLVSREDGHSSRRTRTSKTCALAGLTLFSQGKCVIPFATFMLLIACS